MKHESQNSVTLDEFAGTVVRKTKPLKPINFTCSCCEKKLCKISVAFQKLFSKDIGT